MTNSTFANPYSGSQSISNSKSDVFGEVTEETPLVKTQKQSHDGGGVTKGIDDSESLGYIMLLLAAVFFCLNSLLTRYLGAFTSFGVPSQVFVRGLVQGLLSLVSTWLFLDFRQVLAVPRKYIPHVIVRGICGAACLSLNYKALSLVPLGVTTCILFFHPILTLLLSSVVLGENVGKLDIIAASLSFIGVVLVSNPTLSINIAATHSKGYLLGVISVFIASFTLAFSIILIRSIGTGVNFMSLVLVYSFIVTIAGAVMGGATIDKLTKDPSGLAIALIASIFGFIAQSCVNFGFQRCRAGAGSVVRTIDVPLAFVLALIFLHEVPHTMSIVGSMLVVVGVALVGLKNFRKK